MLQWSRWQGPEISIPANINVIQCFGWRGPETTNIKDASVIRIAWTWHVYPCKYKSNTVFRMTGTRVRKYKRCYSDPDGGDLRSLFNVKVIRMEGTWDLYSCKYKSNTRDLHLCRCRSSIPAAFCSCENAKMYMFRKWSLLKGQVH